MLGRPGMLAAGEEERDGRRVVHRVGVHRLDEAQVVRRSPPVCGRKSLTHAPALPCCLNFVIARQHQLLLLRPAVIVQKRLSAEHRCRDLLPVPLLQLRLVVEQIDVRRRAVLEQVDDALRLRREVRQSVESDRRARPGRERAESHPRSSSDASAAVPMPTADFGEELAAGEIGGALRVADSCGHSLRQRFVEVEQQQREAVCAASSARSSLASGFDSPVASSLLAASGVRR